MSVLKDRLVREPGTPADDAYIDPAITVGVRDASYTARNQQLHLDGQRVTNAGALEPILVDVSLAHVEGGDSYGRVIANTNRIPVQARGDGVLITATFSVESDFSSFYSISGNQLNRTLFDAGGNPVSGHPDHVLGFWFVPLRAGNEMRELSVFMPLGVGGESAAQTGGDAPNFVAKKLLRFSNEDDAVMVEYESDRNQRFESIYLTSPATPTGDQWSIGRADYSVRVYEAVAIGPSGPAGTGARPPFSEADLTDALQNKIEDSLVDLEQVDGSELRTRNHRGQPQDVDATPTHRQMSTVLQGYVKLLTNDGRFDQVASDGTEAAGRLPISTPVVASAEYSTPVDGTATSATAVSANVPVTRTLEALTGADAVGKITRSVVDGKARITFAETGEANITWIEEVQVNSFSNAQGVGRTDGEVVINMVRYNSAGVKQKAWPDEHMMADPQTIAFTFPMRIVTGRVPVDAGDYLEFEVSFVGSRSGQNINYQLIAAHDNFDKRITVHFYSSVAGAVASGTHTDGQIGQLAAQKDVQFAREVQGFEGVTYDRASDKFSGQVSISAALLNADTPEKRAQFRQALGIIGDSVHFLDDDANIDNIIAPGEYVRLSHVDIAGQPFPGPFVLYVRAGDAGGASGKFLKQDVIGSGDREANREVHGQAVAPTSISSTWHIPDLIQDLQAAPQGDAEVEVSANDPAHWTRGWFRHVSMPLVTGGGGSYLSGNINSKGIGRIATAATPWEQSAPRALFDDGPARGRLHVEIFDSAITERYNLPLHVYIRTAGGTRDEEVFDIPIVVWWSAGNFAVFQSTSNLSSGVIADLQSGQSDISIGYQDAVRNEFVYIPGTYQAAEISRNKVTIPVDGSGRIALPDEPANWAVRSNAGQSLIPIPAPYLINASPPDARIRALVRDFAKVAETDADARVALRTLMNAAASDGERFDAATALFNLPEGHNNHARPVTALPDIRNEQLGAEVYLISDTTASAYGVVTVDSSTTTGLRGWYQGSYGGLDVIPDDLNQDALLFFDQSYEGAGAAALRGGVFFVRGSMSTFPTAVELNSVRLALAASAPTPELAHYRKVGNVVSSGYPNGVYTYRVFDGTVNRFGTERLESGNFRADTEALRWRELSGQYTIPEIEALFHNWARIAFEGTIPPSFIPGLATVIEPVGSVTATSANNSNPTLVLSAASNLGATGSLAMFEFIGVDRRIIHSEEFTVEDNDWVDINIPIGGGASYGVEIRSRQATFNDVEIRRTSTGAFLNGVYRVYSIKDAGSSQLPATATQAEAEAGTGTMVRMWTPQRIMQAIAALGSGGGGGGLTIAQIVTGLEALTTTSRLDYNALKNLPTIPTLRTAAQTRDLLEGLAAGSRMSYDNLDDRLDGADLVTLLQGLQGNARLDASAVRNLPTGGGGLTLAQIVAGLEALTTTSRLDYNALKNLPAIPTLRTAAQTRDLLQTLGGNNRLLYSAVRGGPPSNAEQNVNADWNATSGDAQVLNKPTIPTLPAVVGQSEAEAGSATTARLWTAQRVNQAIAALAPSGGGGGGLSQAQVDARIRALRPNAARAAYLVTAIPAADVSVACPVTSVRTDVSWSAWTNVTAATAAITAAQAGMVVCLGNLRGVTSESAGGGDRVHMEARLVRTRGGSDTVLFTAFDYIRNFENTGSPDDFVASSQIGDTALQAFDTAQAGDTYRIQVRVQHQQFGQSPAMTVAFAMVTDGVNNNRVQIAPIGA